jgi:predicted Zn finger-like uncharacterized protein
MIVTCPSCQTRFRLATEKVGPEGARIRCSRCGAIFAGRSAPPPLPRRTTVAAPADALIPPDPFAPPAAAPLSRATPPPAPPLDPLGWGELGLDAEPGPPGGGFDLGASSPAPAPAQPPVPREAPAPPAATPVPGLAPEAAPPPRAREGTPASRATRATRPRRLPWLGPAASLALLVAFAASLVALWRAGGPDRLASALGRREAVRMVEARAVRGGLYEARDGAQALVVRGEVVARSPVDGPVRVRVELRSEGTAVASAEALAGAMATAEEVWEAASPAEALALRRSLDARAAPRLGGGAAVPFLVVFMPPPEAALRGAVALHATADPVRRAP